MTIEWHHIMDKQPQDGEMIVQVDRPYMGHYPMGMREYVQRCPFEELVKYCKDNELDGPDFCWVLAKDFPFPTLQLPEPS